ncbi:MAG TPA: molybdopterin-dependent oxidoreductase [Acetobacteraceae bacterium]|nr:molybdopterin-dependent oxidoreductase [Acetobacteraceae bacterium]
MIPTRLDPQLRAAIERRRLLRGGLSLGALTMLGGCDISDSDAVQSTLHAVSRWNDRVQAWLFSDSRLAKEYPQSAVAKQFRYNAYYPMKDAPHIDAGTYKLGLSGKIADKRPWTVQQLLALPRATQRTRHVCVEGWSYIGEWSGIPLGDFLARVGADTSAKYVGFECADGYYEGIDMPTALHPQTIMAVTAGPDILPAKFGFPLKIRIPTKLGFKNPKWVTAMYVTDQEPHGFWTDRGYNWFSGI